MKFNLLKTSALLCGLSLLGACAQEAPQADNKTTLGDGPRVAVPIELEVSIDAFDAPKSLDQEARAYTGVKTPITVKDGSKKELNDDLSDSSVAQKVLTRSRAKFIEKNPQLDAVVKIDVKKGAEAYTSIGQAKMVYSATKGKYTFGGNINLDQTVINAAKTSGATTTITLYAGGEYDEANKTFKLSSVMEEVSLRDLATTPIELPILYKSEPVAFKVVNGALKPDNSSSVGTLKPLGSLLLVTFRNNMQQTVTFDGINAVSNSFFGPNNQNKQAVYDIATGAFSNTVSYESPYAKSTEGGAGYTYFYKDFSSGSSSLPGGGGISIASGASADKALVFWGFHTGGSAKVSTSNKLKAVTGASMEADILTPSTSLLHVYGQNVTIGGLTPSRPNYSIAPIGGANLTPENGKAYTLNCEFYEQPRQMLGYFAKGYIYKENNATWKDYNFDGNGSNDPNEYLKKSPSAGSGYANNGVSDRKSSADNILLVNSMQANEVRAANGGVSTTKGQMYLPNESWLSLIGLNRPIAFVSNGNSNGRLKTLAGFSSSLHYRGQIVPAELPYKDDPTASGSFQYKGFVYADYHKDYQTLTSRQLATAYRQLYMEPRNGKGYQPRSKYQTIMRVMTTGLYTLVENEGGTDYGTFPSTLTMESLYVGKYFVGNVMTTPLYVTRGASRPFLYAEDGDNFWRNNLEVSRDRVDRALLNVPTFDYNQISKNDLLQDAGSKPNFKNKTKAAPLMNHWGDAPDNVWYSEIIGKGAPTINSVIARNSNIVEGATNQLNNRIYGFHAAATGGIWVLTQRYNRVGAAEKGIVEGRMRTYTYQVLRPYSTKYQGNEGFRNNNN
jgi:lipoprotein